MRLDQSSEKIITVIYDLDRHGCIHELRAIHRPKLDFTDDFLQMLSLDQLRHILVAACMQARYHVRPPDPAPADPPV